MSKTVKELAREAVVTYVRKYPEFDVIASERDYLAGLIERALIEHEKAVREEDATYLDKRAEEKAAFAYKMRQKDFSGTANSYSCAADQLHDAAMAIRARKPVDTEEGA